MRTALFSDIHGNLPALEAVLADIDRRQVDRLYCLGDLVGYSPFPNEVIERIRDRAIPTVMGNYDDGVGLSVRSVAARIAIRRRSAGAISPSSGRRAP